MKTHKRLLTSEKARKYANYWQLQMDLSQAEYCMAELQKSENLAALEPKEFALLECALIRYRRCFTTGVRTQLHNVVKTFPDAQVELHKKLDDITDMHVAHSSNRFEQGWPGLMVSVSEDGAIIRGGLTCSVYSTTGLSVLEYASFQDLIKSVRERVEELIASLSLELTTEIGRMSDAEIMSLDKAGKYEMGLPNEQRGWPSWKTRE